ncbi:protein of unknown function [Methylococcus capsulatus]|uniref:Uncharacterized protein n=1 Tax=Methylococcus capsulatus TaxID=414 RepID=A0AA35V610_METCP|nr:protein of unknown function [Methylococcus capsulatus]
MGNETGSHRKVLAEDDRTLLSLYFQGRKY